MLRNYLIIALRNLRRHLGYALINLVGLSVGIACFLLVFLYLQHEYSFDTYHEQGDRIYRLVEYGGLGEKQWNAYIAGDPVPDMRDTYTDVEDATKYMRCGSNRIILDDEVYRDVKMLCGEPNLFNVFSFDLQQGDPKTLDRPNTAVITQSLAERLFGSRNPVGQTIPIRFGDEERLFDITGLMADVPANTHFTFDLLISYISLESTNRCLTCGQPMYALLKSDADPEVVAARILTLIRDTQGKDYVEDIRLEPLRDIHFSKVLAERQGDQRYVYLLSAIALVMLLIACANYMNLATARSMRRTREVGVRKVVGAHRAQLVRQFLTETLLLTLLALPLALVLLALALPSFNNLANTDVALNWRANLGFLSAIAGVLLVVGLLAGSYPALFLSRLRPVEVLRGQLPVGFSGRAMRRVLVVFQFTASIILIVGTAVILRQLDFIQEKKLGFNAEQVVLVKVQDPELSQKPDLLKQEFLQLAGVLDATAGYGMPGQGGFHGIRYIDYPFGDDGPPVTLSTPPIDEDFLETMNIPLLAGRNITPWQPSPPPPADSEPSDVAPQRRRQEGLINGATIAAMKWGSPEEALGKEVFNCEVVGVVPDFHFQSLHQEITPLVMCQNNRGHAGTIALRLAGGKIPETLAALEATWKATGTTMPFEFSFLTDELNQLYEREQRTARVFGTFAGLAILIACLGLLGLAAFTAAQRTKEIGIRKVLGATVPHLIALLTREFVKLVAIAFIVAAPVAYFAAQHWLEDFAYRIEISWPIFLIAGLAALGIALATISIQAVRAALANPVDSLRYE